MSFSYGGGNLTVVTIVAYRDRKFVDSYQFGHLFNEKVTRHSTEPGSETGAPTEVADGMPIVGLEMYEEVHLKLFQIEKVTVVAAPQFLQQWKITLKEKK